VEVVLAPAHRPSQLANKKDNQTHPGKISDAQMRVLEAAAELAKLNAEKSEAKAEAESMVSTNANAGK